MARIFESITEYIDKNKPPREQALGTVRTTETVTVDIDGDVVQVDLFQGDLKESLSIGDVVILDNTDGYLVAVDKLGA